MICLVCISVSVSLQYLFLFTLPILVIFGAFFLYIYYSRPLPFPAVILTTSCPHHVMHLLLQTTKEWHPLLTSCGTIQRQTMCPCQIPKLLMLQGQPPGLQPPWILIGIVLELEHAKLPRIPRSANVLLVIPARVWPRNWTKRLNKVPSRHQGMEDLNMIVQMTLTTRLGMRVLKVLGLR